MHPEVADALAAGRPVVALESTIISHGLPRPDNLRVAREIEDAVRAAGAVPATIALVAGTARIGLDDDALAQVACSDEVVKVSTRDLATVLFGPSSTPNGTVDLFGALRRAMAKTGYSDLKEFQRVGLTVRS